MLVVSAVFGADSPPRLLRVPLTAEVAESGAWLNAGDFTAEISGAGKGQVVRARTPADDLLLMVVLDVVGDLSLVDRARHTLAEVFKQLPPAVQVALFRAQDGLSVMLDPTADREALEKVLLAWPVNGKAGLLDTIEAAAGLADAIGVKSTVRIAVLYVTDSNVRNYREDFTNPVINSSDSRDLSRRFPEGLVREKISKIKNRLLRSQVPISIVHLAYSSERLNEAYQSGLLELANVTGGGAAFCRSASEIPDAVAREIAHIAGQYQLFVQLPAKTPKSVTLTLESGDRSLSYRSTYVLR